MMRFPSTIHIRVVLLLALSLPVPAQLTPTKPPTKLTLTDAIDLALKNNRALAIGQSKVDEMKSATRKAVADFFPRISNSSTYLHLTETNLLQFAPGSFGTFPGLGSLPTGELNVAQGNRDNILVRTQAAQPLTQLLRVHEGARAARAEERGAEADLEHLQEQIALGVRQLYYGLVAAQLDSRAASAQVEVAEEAAVESEQNVRRGDALEVSLTEARTRLLEAKQDQLTVRIRRSDILAQFNQALRLPQGTQIEVEDQPATPLDLPEKSECIRLAQAATPEIAAAEQVVNKAAAGVRAAKYEYIPDISLFVREDYQNGVAFLFHNYGVFGAEFTYTLFDGGKKRAALREREAQRAQAVENLQRLKDEAAANVERALNKIEQTKSLAGVAKQLVDLRTEADRIADVQFARGVILAAKRSEAAAALAKANTDLIRAQLGYLQSQAELEVLIGRLPR
jgi:outer membrane protein TolC